MLEEELFGYELGNIQKGEKLPEELVEVLVLCLPLFPLALP